MPSYTTLFLYMIIVRFLTDHLLSTLLFWCWNNFSTKSVFLHMKQKEDLWIYEEILNLNSASTLLGTLLHLLIRVVLSSASHAGFGWTCEHDSLTFMFYCRFWIYLKVCRVVCSDTSGKEWLYELLCPLDPLLTIRWFHTQNCYSLSVYLLFYFAFKL